METYMKTQVFFLSLFYNSGYTNVQARVRSEWSSILKLYINGVWNHCLLKNKALRFGNGFWLAETCNHRPAGNRLPVCNWFESSDGFYSPPKGFAKVVLKFESPTMLYYMPSLQQYWSKTWEPEPATDQGNTSMICAFKAFVRPLLGTQVKYGHNTG